MTEHTTEKDWTTKHGHRAVVLVVDGGYDKWRVGYVAVTPDHPLFGVKYSEQADCIAQEAVDKTKLGDKSPILILTATVNSDGDDKIRRSPDVLIECHGGLTYSGGKSNYPTESEQSVWWFGFDCHHCDDTFAEKTLDYCIEQCENISEQLSKLTTPSKPTVSELPKSGTLPA